MTVSIHPTPIHGTITAPPSKSQTIRAFIVALLADGTSTITAPLIAADTQSSLAACGALGAQITKTDGGFTIKGCAGAITPLHSTIDVGNSGTTLRLISAVAALGRQAITISGDAQARTRPMQPLLQALTQLGATVSSNGGTAPVTICGPLRGGAVTIACATSQYLSALLLAAPLAQNDVTINVSLLNEQPYVEMTLEWLRACNITVERDALRTFTIPARQRYAPTNYHVEGDYSSATFFLCAAALVGTGVTIKNLAPDSLQGDRQVIDILQRMGCEIDIKTGHIFVHPVPSQEDATPYLRGGQFDLNAIPDALPALMVVACNCKTASRFTNVAHARIKESDRIAVMAAELRKMGAQITETEEGVVIQPTHTPLVGTVVDSHNDHRIAMALSVAALAAKNETRIKHADAIQITYPNFFTHLEQLTQQQVKQYA